MAWYGVWGTGNGLLTRVLEGIRGVRKHEEGDKRRPCVCVCVCLCVTTVYMVASLSLVIEYSGQPATAWHTRLTLTPPRAPPAQSAHRLWSPPERTHQPPDHASDLSRATPGQNAEGPSGRATTKQTHGSNQKKQTHRRTHARTARTTNHLEAAGLSPATLATSHGHSSA